MIEDVNPADVLASIRQEQDRRAGADRERLRCLSTGDLDLLIGLTTQDYDAAIESKSVQECWRLRYLAKAVTAIRQEREQSKEKE